MDKLYKKSEIIFAIVWIAIYVISLSFAESVTIEAFPNKVIPLIVGVILTIIIFLWMNKHKLLQEYGICSLKISSKKLLYFLPLLIIISGNFWFGITVKNSLIEIICYVLSMLCVGFLEEIIFRGFLFKAMIKDNVKVAIAVSSITFGVGHIVNLINGSGMDLFSNLMQIIYATAAGFLFTIIFYKGKSLWPCIIAHGLVNASSVFVDAESLTKTQEISVMMVWTVISVAYAIYILKLKEIDK